jgi:hypothetical protein
MISVISSSFSSSVESQRLDLNHRATSRQWHAMLAAMLAAKAVQSLFRRRFHFGGSGQVRAA